MMKNRNESIHKHTLHISQALFEENEPDNISTIYVRNFHNLISIDAIDTNKLSKISQH